MGAPLGCRVVSPLDGSSGMHHSPAFDIDEDALRTGARVLVAGRSRWQRRIASGASAQRADVDLGLGRSTSS